jgi:hypothetical protein
MSLLHEDPSNSEVIHICVNFEQIDETKELQHKGQQKLLFQILNCLLLLFFPFRKQLIFY